jgi:hypothetical protein
MKPSARADSELVGWRRSRPRARIELATAGGLLGKRIEAFTDPSGVGMEMEHRLDLDAIVANPIKHPVRKAAKQGASNAGLNDRIRLRVFGDAGERLFHPANQVVAQTRLDSIVSFGSMGHVEFGLLRDERHQSDHSFGRRSRRSTSDHGE